MKKVLVLLTTVLCLLVSAFALTACGDPTIESISANTSQAKVVYKANEAFTTKGLVITANMSDDSKQDLTADQYTLDTSAFDKTKAGEYEIKVKLNADETKTCSFKVTVKAVTAISAKAGYDNKFTQYEYPDLDEINLVIIETYSDGSTEEVSGEKVYELYEGYIDTYEIGTGKKIEIKSRANSKITCEITYDVLSEDTLTVKTFTLVTAPETTTLNYEDRYSVGNYFYDVEFKVTYEEIPNREYKLYWFDVDNNCDSIYSAEEAGKYNAIFTYGGKSVEVEFTLVDVSSYTLDSVKVDTTAATTKYFKGEKVESDQLADVTLLATYKKAGAEDIVLVYCGVNLTVDVTDLTKTTGKKTVQIKENDENLCTYEIEVVEIVIADGLYLSDNGGAYMEEFKKNGDTYSFLEYDSSEGKEKWVDGYKFVDITRSYDNTTVYINFVKDGKKETVYADKDGKLADYIQPDSNDYKVMIVTSGLEQAIYAIDGKISEEFANMISAYGDAHLDSKTGTLIDNLSEYEFTKDAVIYLVFQQDATGQEFLGNYNSTNQEMPWYIVVTAENAKVYASKSDYTGEKSPMITMEYRFEIEGNKVTVTLQQEGMSAIIDLEKKEMDLDMGGSTVKLTLDVAE